MYMQFVSHSVSIFFLCCIYTCVMHLIKSCHFTILLSWYQSTNFSSMPTFLFLLSLTTTIVNTNDHNSTLITINVAAQTPVKLTSTNYLAWKLQFQTLFIGYDLHGFIDGSHPCPASLLPDTTTPNLAYTLWIRQDQLLLNAICCYPIFDPYFDKFSRSTPSQCHLLLPNF